MSTLKERLTEAMKAAMKAKEKERLGTIRMALAEVKRVEVDERIEVEDSRLIGILTKMVKQRKESASQFQAADRTDLADKELQEINVLSEFLPAPLSDEEVNALITQAIEQIGANSVKELGKVIGQLKPQLQGRADLSEVSKRVKERLS